MGQLRAKTMMQKAGFLDSDKKTPEHDKIQIWVNNNAKLILDSLPILENKEYKIQSKNWEYKLVDDSYQNRYISPIVGFVDVSFDIETKTPIFSASASRATIYIEIKTSIPSLGELIRQLRFYEHYLDLEKGNRMLVVSPDDTHKTILEEQGFWFYKYKDETKLF